MAFIYIAGVSFSFSQIFVVIVFCSILPASHQDLFSEALEQELEEELFSASISRQNRETKSVYDASGIEQTPICGLNSLSSVNRRKRENEPEGNHDWPWMAAILEANGYKQFCGGTLLNRQYILTAAHCFAEPGSEKTVDDVVVRLGEYDIFEDEETKYQEVLVKTIETHESYDPSTKHNDIALIKLDRSVEYDQYVRPLCLPSIEAKPNETIYVAGWGATQSNGEHSNILLDVAIPVVDHATCADLHGPNIDKEKNLCAGTQNKDSCQGDSGGPLLLQEPEDQKRWMIVGVVSWGRGCGDYTPGVYTNVKHYLDWIKHRILDAKI